MSHDRWPVHMTVETAAAYLDRSVSKIEKLIASGELPVFQEGTKSNRYILRADCDAYAQRCAEQARTKQQPKEPTPAV